MLVQLSRHFNLSPEAINNDQVKECLFHCKEKGDLSNGGSGCMAKKKCKSQGMSFFVLL
jgi:hypothetical protein